MSAEGDTSSPNAGSAPQNGPPSDPCNFVKSPPSVIVKVTGTARADINGLLGVVLSFNRDKRRYLVHMTMSQSTMAFKMENLAVAGFVDKCRAQLQQFQNDPRVREKLQHYLRTSQQYVAPWNLRHVVMGLAAFVIFMFYIFGYARTIMVLSLVSLLIVISSPDLAAKKPIKVVAANFPARAKQAIEKNAPFLRGKVSERMALGVVLFVVGMTAATLLAPLFRSQPLSKPVFSGSSASRMSMESHAELLKKYYSLGFEDATATRDQGSSLTESVIAADLDMLAASSRSSSNARVLGDDIPTDDYIPSPPPLQNKGFFGGLFGKASSISNIMSMVFLYRSVMSLGTEAQTGLFSFAQLAANFRGLPVWRQGLLGLGVARVAYGFLA